MKYPNAAKGMNKIFAAEILKLIGTLSMVVAAGLLVLTYFTGKAAVDTGNGADGAVAVTGFIGLLVFAGAGLVLMIIAFIMNLIGIINATRDEESFKSALIFWVITIALCATAAGLFMQTVNVSGILYSAAELTSLIVKIFVIVGGVKLADRLNSGEVARKGANVLKLIIAVNVLSVLISAVAPFIKTESSMISVGGVLVSIVSLILILLDLVLSVVSYIMYLSFLAKAKKMLKAS